MRGDPGLRAAQYLVTTERRYGHARRNALPDGHLARESQLRGIGQDAAPEIVYHWNAEALAERRQVLERDPFYES